MGHAEDTEWTESGVTFYFGEDELNEVDFNDPNWLDRKGFLELEKCSIAADEFDKRNVCAFNVKFLTDPSLVDIEGEWGGGEGREEGGDEAVVSIPPQHLVVRAAHADKVHGHGVLTLRRLFAPAIPAHDSVQRNVYMFREW